MAFYWKEQPMPQVKKGDKVQVHYTGWLSDGEVFDSSQGRGPLEFTVGASHVIAGFDEAVVGMSPGEAKTVRIPAKQAYGVHDDDLVIEMDRTRMPEDLDLEVDDELQVRRSDGQIVNVTVTEISDEVVTMDANHPLAGKELTFEIALVNIL
jgi:peptidylprolyl isomerase